MTYIENKGDKTRVFDVSYNKDQLEDLLNKIVRECSYKVKGEFRHRCGEIRYGYMPYQIIDGPRLPNGESLYQDITRIYDDFDGMCSCFDTIEGSKVIVPELANIVARLIKEDSSAIDSLLAYENSDELVSVYTKIDETVNEIHKKSSSTERNVDKLIELSKGLEELRNKQIKNQYFDPILLGYYYSMIKCLISYELVSEKKNPVLGRRAPQFSKR